MFLVLRCRSQSLVEQQSGVGREQVNHYDRNQCSAEFPLIGYLLLLFQPFLHALDFGKAFVGFCKRRYQMKPNP